MNKGYFLVKPSSFSRYGKIDIDGNYEFVKCKDFDLDEPKENYLIFEVRYDEEDGVPVYEDTCVELVTKGNFDLSFEKRRKKNGEIVSTVVLYSENLGLYSRVLPVSSIEVMPSKVAGLCTHFSENPAERLQYCGCLKAMVDEASKYKKAYDESIDGPSRSLKSQMRKSYRRA